MRLRDLGLAVGALPPGPGNAVTDVPGVRVGHAPGAAGGITALLPFGPAPRRYFVGRWALDGGDEMTGLALAEDFGALSAPIVLAPLPAVGRVYDGVLTYDFGIDPGLSEDEGWPPVVVPVDGSPYAADTLHAALGQAQVAAAIGTASSAPPAEGQVGVGRGLAAFGARAGVGSSSRRAAGGTLGALVAANGGEPARLAVDGRLAFLAGLPPLPAHRPRTFAAVVVTDAPLIPGQLARLAGRAAFGLVRVGLLDAGTRAGLVVAVSTTGLDDEQAAPGSPGSVVARTLPEAALPELFAAAAEACEEAVLNALVAASTQAGVDGTPPLPASLLPGPR